ncbi:Angiopoietin-related protein 3 Angiopoietin-like protein 3 ANGPTL3(17-224) Precursor [Channa argus]|uniref:Angiopoietin-related protein 3 Angiopoietin-like protein 3 ANGPTL3(17-224) n=1 Tax=Channa argus TaxID=215402 RepID=A0A6G1Q983_CHAAH|nr:Angiopoietin-related protein 3 Angiopoietin-like protein 3 ANGPTL3(17-224) Precursor [Channa argus]
MRIPLFPILFILAAACVASLCGKEELPVIQPEAPAETRSHFAALDDVRLLANGLLQLGQSLREFVQKTKGQINDIFQKLNIFDHSFYQLSVIASEIKEEEEELKKTAVILKASNEEIKDLSVEISSKINSILVERTQLQNKVEGLEKKLSSLSHGLMTSEQVAEINGLRDVIQSQEQSITKLLVAVSEQSDQINQQRIKIKALEEKLSANTAPQETIERMPEIFNSEAPTLSPYLATSSTSTATMIRYGATVIQRRKDGSVNFDQTWDKYENGFGDLQKEFWLGLRKIHSLATLENSVLHIQLQDWKQGRRFIKYRFYLDGAESNYTIHLTQLSGDLPDPMSNHTGMMFSTKDRDNNYHQDSNCTHKYTGGWWFSTCGDTNLNGRYFHIRPKGRRRGIQWKQGRKASYSLKFTQISIHPAAPPSISSSISASTEAGIFP